MAKWINFVEFAERLEVKKTKIWWVVPKNSTDHIGRISWYGPWRKYCFFTTDNKAVFEWRCLRDIADFCEQQTLAYRKSKTNANHSQPTGVPRSPHPGVL